MGTAYEIKIISSAFSKNKTKIVEAGIDSILFSINNSMSTYIDSSEISLINKNRTKDKIKVSSNFYYVLQKSIEYNNLTENSFDPTIKPLLEIWGFRGKEVLERPNPNLIKNTLEYVGSDKLLLYNDNYIEKTHPMVSLDFGGIAKGYAVDEISNYLKELGYNKHSVDIGGEMVCKGKDWKIGIAYPEFNSSKIYKRIKLSNHGVATSGTYNQSLSIDDFEYSHIFDPKLGEPSKNNVISVTVISKTSIYSDGLSTSLKVLGKDKGLNLINDLEGVECMFIVKENGEFRNYLSDNFSDFFID